MFCSVERKIYWLLGVKTSFTENAVFSSHLFVNADGVSPITETREFNKLVLRFVQLFVSKGFD